MKTEPLKGKECNYHNEQDLDEYTPIFYKEDIKSAVEWLKAQLNTFTQDEYIRLTTFAVEDLIDEAFEDVVKKKDCKKCQI